MAEIAANSKERRPTDTTAASAATEIRSKYPLLGGTNEISAVEFMSQLSSFVQDFRHLPAPTPQPTLADELAAYAAQPDSVRQAVIKDMICEYLGDDNFIKLTEDVSREWTRVGLGF